MKLRNIVALICALAASAAMADKLYLKSGSMLTGKAGTASTGELVFVSDDLGEVKVKLENIERLEDAGSHVVRYDDDTRETMGLAVEKGAWIDMCPSSHRKPLAALVRRVCGGPSRRDTVASAPPGNNAGPSYPRRCSVLLSRPADAPLGGHLAVGAMATGPAGPGWCSLQRGSRSAPWS